MKIIGKRKRVYIGMSQNSDSSEAGKETAEMAASQLAGDEEAAWALAFCGGRHDGESVIRGLRSRLGEVEIVGGSAVGTITSSSIGYGGYECVVALFPTSIPMPLVVVGHDMERGEADVGLELGEKLRDIADEGATVLLFYDSIRSFSPPKLYVGSRLLDGIYKGLSGKRINLVGAGILSDFQLSGSFIFDGKQSVKHAAAAVVFPPSFISCTTIMHGCIPVSSFLEITRIDGPVIYELNGRPATEVIKEITELDHAAIARGSLSLGITFGEKHGDLYGPYDESAYVNRIVVDSDSKEGTVTLFGAGFRPGTKVQIMTRDNRMMMESVRERTRKLLESFRRADPIFALYIDCAGRTSAFSGSETEEAEALQSELRKEVPFLGFYSGAEIATLFGRSCQFNWTGVLTLFALEDN